MNHSNLFRSSMRSSSGSFLFISLSMLRRRELDSVQLTSPHSTHYRHTRHMLPHNDDGVITFLKYFNNF
jgi:hypothetical protein